MQPLNYFVSALPGSADADILVDLESRIGSYADKLTPQQKSAYRLVLSLYLHWGHFMGAENYTLCDATTDVLDFLPESMVDDLLALEGISDDNAEALISFFANLLRELEAEVLLPPRQFIEFNRCDFN